MDCPGLYDTSKTQENISVVIVQAVACTYPGPHAILFIIRLGRFSPEEYEAYQRLKALFDDAVCNYIILLFTGGDEMEDTGKTFDDVMRHAPDSLTQVIKECGHRYLVFNNKARNTKSQVEMLLNQVKEMRKHNDEEYYTCPRYNEIGKGLEEEVQKRLATLEKRDSEREKYVRELEAKTKEAQRAVEETLAALEKNDRERALELEKERERGKEVETLLQRLKAAENELDTEKRKRKEVELRDRMQQMKLQQDQFRKKLEEDRRTEEENLKKLQLELQALERVKEEAERREQERQDRAYQEELKRMKDGVAKCEEYDWMDRTAEGVASVITAPFRFLGRLFRS